jgi:ketohexokinase
VRVLGVGIATLDVVHVVDRYPTEDAEVRALDLHRRRGGNATNTLAALDQLGHGVSWAGTVADDAESLEVLGLARGEGIDTRHAVVCPGGRTPTSCVTSSLATGSRTIVHHRDLREYGAEDFARVPLTGLDWVHFEGRNVGELGPMLRRCRDEGVPCSLEVEKPRDGIEALLDLPDLVLFSRQYAHHRGFADGASLLQSLPERAGQALYCAWGDAGAWAIGADRVPAHSPAFPPARLVDTVGAGDVFNAGVIDGQLRGLTVPAILRHACRLAGVKCGRNGLSGVADALHGGLALCRVVDLADPGSRGLQLAGPGGRAVALFLVRSGGRVRAYRNCCPHTGAPLEWRPHQFLDFEGRFIQCALHGALFTPEDGRCVRGPCAGDALTAERVTIVDGWVVWSGSDEARPGR